MEKRTLLAVAICMGILLVWWKLFPPTPPPHPTPAPAVSANANANTSKGEGTLAVPGGANLPMGERKGPEQLVTLDVPGHARFVLSSWGGVLRDVILEEPRFLRDRKDPQSGYDIIGPSTPETSPLRLTFPKADFPSPEAGPWTITQPAPNQAVFRAENDQVAIEKRYQIEGPYRLALEVVIENKKAAPVDEALALHLYGRQDPEKKGGGFWNATLSSIANLLCRVNGKVERSAIEALFKEPKQHAGDVSWIAADDKYFLVAAVPVGPAGESRTCDRRGFDAASGEVQLLFGSRTLAPSAQTSYRFTIYAGPKHRSLLTEVKPNGTDVELDKAVDVTFAVLSKPLLWLLKLFHSWVQNWGLAIIMLTIFVKLVTFYPTQRAMMSGRKMQRLGPKMQALRKKHENDRQRLGVETMALYKQEGVSPFGGCLPSLITMPIWIALYSTLNYAVELHRVPFFGYIHDLSARDPFFITPLLMGGAMFAQMRMSPAGADPAQQKMMAVMMPVMFTAFSMFLPAGLALYTLTNSLLMILQQVLVNHLEKKHHPMAA